jgi:hypothetical protein
MRDYKRWRCEMKPLIYLFVLFPVYFGRIQLLYQMRKTSARYDCLKRARTDARTHSAASGTQEKSKYPGPGREAIERRRQDGSEIIADGVRARLDTRPRTTGEERRLIYLARAGLGPWSRPLPKTPSLQGLSPAGRSLSAWLPSNKGRAGKHLS